MEELSDKEILRRAVSILGRMKSDKKAAAVRENGKLGGRPKGPGKPYTEEVKARMRQAQQARRERETRIKTGESDQIVEFDQNLPKAQTLIS